MSDRYIDFSVSLNGKSPQSLQDSVRRVRDASAGFSQSWLSGAHADALKTSQEAFTHLDFILSELIRQRDVQNRDSATWPTSPLKLALDASVGLIVEPLSSSDVTWFTHLPQGHAALPPTASAIPVTLGKALNKLKHRHTTAVNFSLAPHTLFACTSAGMGKEACLVQIQILLFGGACSSAADSI